MRRTTNILLTMGFGLLLVGVVFCFFPKEIVVPPPIEALRVRITSSTEIPDPAHIDSAGKWYFLDHVSSGLVAYDSEQKKFVPLFAESWSAKADGTHVFTLRPGIRFSDGTPISVKDVIWTLKRQLVLKTSTHFPFYEYIVGCEDLNSLEDECVGIQALSDREISIHLKTHTDSFFLQLASPETAIWSASDMNAKTLSLTPTKFSGPYFVEKTDDTAATLRRNENSPISRAFPNSPRSIILKRIPLNKLDDALLAKEVDLVVRSHRPLGERDWANSKIGVTKTTPSTIIYFFGTGRGQRLPIGRDLIEQVWLVNLESTILPAETFLPFANKYGLTRSEYLEQLPKTSAPKIRVLCPVDFFSDEFLAQIESAAQVAGSRIEFIPRPGTEWLAAFDDPLSSEKYDYILSSYAASERYPAVQLRQITEKLVTPPIDLKIAESPDSTVDRAAVFKSYQRWLLQSRQAIPLFFNVTMFLYQSDIDIGAQPSSDAEIELWRVQKKIDQ